MLETKMMRVKPVDERDCLAINENFGWHVAPGGIRRDHREYQEKQGDRIVTVLEEWVDIQFQRDPERLPAYSEIVRLEQEWGNAVPPAPPSSSGGWAAAGIGCLGGVIWAMVFTFLGTLFSSGALQGFATFTWIPVAIGLGIYYYYQSGGAARGKAAQAEYQAATARHNEHMNAILQKAWQLSHEY